MNRVVSKIDLLLQCKKIISSPNSNKRVELFGDFIEKIDNNISRQQKRTKVNVFIDDISNKISPEPSPYYNRQQKEIGLYVSDTKTSIELLTSYTQTDKTLANDILTYDTPQTLETLNDEYNIEK
jgi:hypothetical protein